jgi:hypothetical protein
VTVVSAVRLGGFCLVAFVPILVVGALLYSRIGVSSQTDGSTALKRIAEAGASFPIVNALFHLGALLLIPAGVSLATSLRTADVGPWIDIGMGFLILAVVVAAGFVFSLNHGLWVIATGPGITSEGAGPAYAAAADSNLATQRGAELVQSMGLGLWLLASATAMAAAGWLTWLVGLSVLGGAGFIVAGLSSVLMSVPVVGPALGALGALGLVMFMVWDLATGIRLLSLT